MAVKVIENYNDLQVDDVIEAYIMEEIKRKYDDKACRHCLSNA